MGNIIQPGRRIRRATSLGQLDHEMDYGPSPVGMPDVPIDLRPRNLTDKSQYQAGGAAGAGGDISQLIDDVHQIAGVLRLQRGLLGSVIPITSQPTLLVQANDPGGILLLNPAGVVGLTAKSNVFTSTTLVGATTLTSADFGVANFKTARFVLIATVSAGAGPVTFDLQTLDPVSGSTFVTTQTIFNITATGNFYAFVDQMGIDTDFQVVVTVPGGTTITFTLGVVLKDGLSGTSAGLSQTIFIGGPGVSPTAGYPILAGYERSFYLTQNVQLFGVTNGATLNMNVFRF